MWSHTVRNFVFAILMIKQNGAASTLNSTSNSTLQLVHILFRHGDRTTDLRTLYPKDPYINETYYPYGLGELTKDGKRKEYNLGKFLRVKYGHFLDQTYTPDLLEARSSDTNRTKMSLQLVLAGLFPPVGEQIFEPGLNWQPIPFSALPRNQDTIFMGVFCSNFKKPFSELINSAKWQREFRQHLDIFSYISENTGLQIKSYYELFWLYLCLTTEKEYGLKLPEWTEKVYPQPLEAFAIKTYELFTANTKLRRLVSGSLLKKIIDDSNAKINNELSSKNRKLYLYSGHELNIACLLETLDIFKSHIPPYGAYVAFELHEIDNVYGFKIYYQDYSSPEPKLLKLPACEEFCPLDQFISLVEEYLPETNFC